MSDDKKYGVINEQGFAAGFGLGFEPVSEDEQEKLDKDKSLSSNDDKKN